MAAIFLGLGANGERQVTKFRVPPAPAGRAWHGIADTGAPPPGDWTPLAESRPFAAGIELPISPRSLLLLAAR